MQRVIRLLLVAFGTALLAGAAVAAEPCGPRRLALSFDDAPRPSSALMTGGERPRRIIAALDGAGIEGAIFFAVTRNLDEEGRARLAAYAAAGHVIANHSHRHPDLNRIGADAFLEDVRRAHRLLSPLPGFRPLFRFPMLREGATVEQRDRVRAGLAELGYRHGYVTIDNYDFYIDALLGRAAAAGREVDREALGRLYVEILVGAAEHYDALACAWLARSPAHVLLLHENDMAALYLDRLIVALRAAGWEIIPALTAYADPIAAAVPDTLVLNQGRVAALAHLAGAPRAALHPIGEEEAWLEQRFAAILASGR